MRFEYQVPSLAGLDDEQDLCDEDYAEDGLRGLEELNAAKARKGAPMLRSMLTMPGMPGTGASRLVSIAPVSPVSPSVPAAEPTSSKALPVILGVGALLGVVLLLRKA